MLYIFIEPFNFSFFGISDRGIDLDYCDIEWFALEMNRDHSVVFEIAPKNWASDSFVDYEGYSISSKGFLPTAVDKWSCELNLPIRFSGEGNGTPLQYSCLENPMDGGAW